MKPGEDQEKPQIIICKSLTFTDEFYIFRPNGVEVVVKLLRVKLIESSHELTDEEEEKLRREFIGVKYYS